VNVNEKISTDTTSAEIRNEGKSTIVHNGEKLQVDCKMEDNKTVCRD